MMKFFREASFFKQFVILLTVTIFIPIIIIGAISYTRASMQIEILADKLIDQIVDKFTGDFDRVIEENDFLSARIASKNQVRQFVEHQPQDYYEKYDFYTWMEDNTILQEIFLKVPIIASVSIIGNSGVSFSFDNINLLQNKRYIKNHMDILVRAEFYKKNLSELGSMRVFTNDVLYDEKDSQATRALYISLARRVFKKGSLTPAGVMVIDINIADLVRELKGKGIDDRNIWIIDNNDRILFQSNTSYIGKTVQEIFNKKLQWKNDGSFTGTVDNTQQYFVYRTSAKTGWRIIESIPVKDLNIPLKNLGNVLFFTILVILPVTLLIGYLFLRSIMKPLINLRNAMKEAGNENWVIVEESNPNNEMGKLVISYNKMVRKISGLIETVYKAELQQKERELIVKNAELQMLQMQINPHFLYNTLGTINAYAVIANQVPIQEMLESLSFLFRYSIRDFSDGVKLKDEIEYVNNYLNIQRYRQKIMPEIKWEVEGYLEYPVLRLILQPIIENIFQHAFPNGIMDYHKIRIYAEKNHKSLIIGIKDNGVGVPWSEMEDVLLEDSDYKLGIGLKNVNRRLKLAYGDEYGLEIYRLKRYGTEVKLKILLDDDIKAVDS